jgi:hypothetical protein
MDASADLASIREIYRDALGKVEQSRGGAGGKRGSQIDRAAMRWPASARRRSAKEARDCAPPLWWQGSLEKFKNRWEQIDKALIKSWSDLAHKKLNTVTVKFLVMR